MRKQIESFEELQKKLAELLTSGSLYRSITYDGAKLNYSYPNNFPEGGGRYGVLPKYLSLFCDTARCKQVTNWEIHDPSVPLAADRVHQEQYVCRNCGRSGIVYCFRWWEEKGESIFLKVGQWPPLAIEPPKELTNALNKSDFDLYRKALINANFNHGIGAVSYLRRVIENRLNDLLDLIHEAVQHVHADAELTKRVEEIKKGHSVEDKITLASKMLPKNLKPEGTEDPFKKLYAAASAGLHGESDEECLDIFNNAKFIFEYLFRNLTVGNEEAREYARRLSNPVRDKK